MTLVARHIGKKAGMEGWVGMAGRAVGGQVGKVIIDMAFRTFQTGMGTGQGELSLRVVERSRKPDGGGMTRATVGAKLTTVRIILGMTGITVGGQIGEDRIDVTL
jgi:hypothetical protein